MASIRGSGKASAELRKARRREIRARFVRWFARKPMWDGVAREFGTPSEMVAQKRAIAWGDGLDQWRRDWKAARENSSTVRLA